MDNIIFSFVLPTYNERDNIRILIPSIIQAFSDFKIEIIVVDDGSKDGTLEIIKNFQTQYPNIRLIKRDFLGGIGSALKDGYSAALGQYIISVDADLSFSAEDLKKIGNLLLTNQYDLVIGSRHMKGGYYQAINFNIFKKKAISVIGNNFIRLMTNLPFHDFSANCRGLKNEKWKQLNLADNSNFMLFEMIAQSYRKNFKIIELPVTFLDRKFGKAKLKLEKEALRSFFKFMKSKYLRIYSKK